MHVREMYIHQRELKYYSEVFFQHCNCMTPYNNTFLLKAAAKTDKKKPSKNVERSHVMHVTEMYIHQTELKDCSEVCNCMAPYKTNFLAKH